MCGEWGQAEGEPDASSAAGDRDHKGGWGPPNSISPAIPIRIGRPTRISHDGLLTVTGY